MLRYFAPYKRSALLFLLHEKGLYDTLALAQTVSNVTFMIAYLAGIDLLSVAFLLLTTDDGNVERACRADRKGIAYKEARAESFCVSG